MIKFATCKLDLITDNEKLSINKKYKVSNENEICYFIITDGNRNNPFFLVPFYKSDRNPGKMQFNSYFYNIKEERKLKIKKLNEKICIKK